MAATSSSSTVGRERELERMAALLGDVRSGSGGTLVVTGEAGAGKTTLLREAELAAGALRVFWIRGLEAEPELPFAAVKELVEPLLDRLPALPAPQRRALEGALALGPPVPGDRFAACVGVYGLLRDASRERPIVLLVDDAQWLDAASAECIGFSARRVAGEPVAVFVALRTGEASRLDPAGFDAVELPPLNHEAARRLVRERHGALPHEVLAAVLEEAGGNPLALIELPSGLSPEQRAGRAALERPLAPGKRLGEALARRVAPLPADARLALLAAAAAGSRDPAPFLAACRELGLGPEALEPAEVAALIRFTPDSADFAHPLLRATVYERAPAEDRRRVHGALAAHVPSGERGWHLAAAAIGPDEEAAAELERTARHALERGAPIVAADALERASDLSPDPRDAGARLIAAGNAARDGGMHTRAAAVLEGAARSSDPNQRGEALEALAMLSLYEAGNATEAHRILLERARNLRAGDPVAAAGVLANAALAATVAGDCHLALKVAEEAHDLLGPGGDATTRAQVLAILSWSHALRGHADRARQLLAEVDSLLPQIDPFSPAAQSIALAINSRVSSEEYERARDECGAIVAGAREAGMIGLIPFPLAVEADALERLGEWDAAEARALEAIALAEETGQRGPLLQALVILLYLTAERGEEQRARDVARRILAIAEPADFGAMKTFTLAGLGLLELGLGRLPEATETLERVAALTAEQGLEEPTLVPWAPDLVEAHAEAGNNREAGRVCARLSRQAQRAGRPYARFLAARAEGAIAADFDRCFEHAYALEAERPVPFHRARAELAHGSRLLQSDRRSEARDRLRSALATFERLGAAPWSGRAQEQLRSAGAVRREPVYGADELTAQEIRIALAVARGATNKEVAADLFLSPRTIEYHLGQVYRKLGIGSRTELARRAAQGDLDAAPGP